MLPIRVFNRCSNAGNGGPLATLTRWSRGFDDLFDQAFAAPAGTGFNVDIRQDGDDLVVEAELPGVSKDDLEITVEDGTLTIATEYKSATEDEKTNYHVRERRRDRYSRSFRLPQTADADNVAASLSHGVLTLRIPTREEAKPRRIEVK